MKATLNDYIVTPHKSIGPIQLGMSKAEIDHLFQSTYIEEIPIDSLFFKGEENMMAMIKI